MSPEVIRWFSGKILTDESPISEYNIDEKKFIVVMVSKPKSAPAPNTGPADPTAPPAQPEPEPRPAEERLVSVLLYCMLDSILPEQVSCF